MEIRRQILPMALILVMILGLCGLDSSQAAEFSRETPVVKAVRRSGPAVVNISAKQTTSRRGSPFFDSDRDDLFSQFFRDFFDLPERREGMWVAIGSGVIIDGQRGYILTNAHVVENVPEIKVILGDEREFLAKVVGSDPDSDLAVLQIVTKDVLPSLKMGDSSNLMIGETVIAIGNPFGLAHTVTTGVISAINRQVRTENRVYRDFIQTDASINPGNSGGPLLNINGELIGINTAVYNQANGIGFAIPITKAERIIKRLIAQGEILPVWLGFTLQDVTPRLARYFKTPKRDGALITKIEPGSPAAKSRMKQGDVIIGLGRQNVRSVDDYEDLLRTYTAQEKVGLTVFRQGKARKYNLVVQTFPLEKAMEISRDRYGLGVEKRKRDRGVLVERVNPDSPAARIRLRPGDIIHQINEARIKTVEDYLKAIARYRLRYSLSLVVQRGRYAYNVTLTP